MRLHGRLIKHGVEKRAGMYGFQLRNCMANGAVELVGRRLKSPDGIVDIMEKVNVPLHASQHDRPLRLRHKPQHTVR
jgi:hypothetical protein